jgi:hypothetical protein
VRYNPRGTPVKGGSYRAVPSYALTFVINAPTSVRAYQKENSS